jgi:hypothetical protein
MSSEKLRISMMGNESSKSLVFDSDREKDGVPTPEAINFIICHEPDNKLAVNGFEYVIRLGGKTFQILVREGEETNHSESNQYVVYETGSSDYLELIASRYELLAEVQGQILAAAPQISTLLDDIKLS